MEWMTCAMSGLNVDVAAMKKSAQLLPCFAGLPPHCIIFWMMAENPSRAAYTIGEVLPG